MSHVELPATPLTPQESDRLRPITDHILLHFCDNEQLLSDYLTNWLAFPLQQLGDKTGVAVVVKGKPGTGKGQIFNVLMRKIYGEHYHQCKDIQDLTGTFNSHTVQKLLVNLDEATFGGLKRENQILKNFITEPRATLTEKFKDSVEINSYVNLVITTNEDFPVAITEGDRRYFVLEYSEHIANKDEYWSPMMHLFKDDLDETADLFYRYLMTRDLTDFRVRVFPHTQARAAIMHESRDNVTAFLQHLAMNPDTALSNRHDAKFISSGRLYELYKAFVESDDVYGKQMGKVNFGRRMNQLLPACLERKYVDGGQTRGYKVPKSSDLEKMMREKGQWSDDQF
ncbi:g7787 [Coccomyxa elongata]